ncbi:hypothetical protein L2E82_40948 [Cichorium intybus]|uniref:Uncharacterized protein n=1 Tax=Cichorium intybus TaxID=13427 RepID=A0ACB9ALI9_CICIN|nr:hypothetical protein L2E82_40948 [Cichorium intybus]
MNVCSSRSHSCLMVHVCGKDFTTNTTVRGCMHLVDLAGSERADKPEAKSLSALGDPPDSAQLHHKNPHPRRLLIRKITEIEVMCIIN